MTTVGGQQTVFNLGGVKAEENEGKQLGTERQERLFVAVEKTIQTK